LFPASLSQKIPLNMPLLLATHEKNRIMPI
jgi:hypothetical protein